MKITGITLDNFMSHRKLSTPITGNVVGILGPNGSGKSSILLAIESAFTGSFQKGRGKKNSVTFGEKSGSVSVDFTCSGGSYTILREIGGSDKAELSRPGGPISGARAVNPEIERILGVDAETLKRVVFVGQREIDGILFASPASRLKMVQNLFDLERAEDLHSQIQVELTRIPQPDDSIQGRLDEARENLRSARERAAAAAASPGLSGPSQRDIDRAAELRVLISSARGGEARVILERDIAELEEAMSRVMADAAKSIEVESQFDLCDLRSRLSAEQARERRAAIVAGYPDAEADRAAIPGLKAEIEDLSNRGAALAGEIGGLAARLEQARSDYRSADGSLKAISSGSGVCGACGQEIGPNTVAAFEAARARAAEEEGRLSTEMSELSERRAGINAAISPLRSRHSALCSKVSNYDHALSSTPEPETPPDGWVGSDRLAGAIGMVEKAAAAASEARARCRDLKAQIEAKSERARSLPATDGSNAGEMERELEEINARIAEASTAASWARVELSAAESDVSRFSAEEGMLSSALEADESNRRKRDLVSSLRDIFHHGSAARMVIQRRIAAIASRMNSYLRTLEAPFHVTVRDGMDFVCHFDGKDVPAEMLSGGEQIALAVSFRIASSETFARGAGLLVLDEPTVWLDKRRKERFSDLVEGLKAMAAEAGMQFFVVTHEESLRGFFDQIIDLGDPPE